MAARFGRQCASARALGKLTCDHARNQKRQESNPVLRICDGEVEQWWQEEVVVSYGSQDGGECGIAQTPVCGDEQDRQQKTESHRRVIDMQPSKAEKCNCCHNDATQSKTEHLAFEWSFHCRVFV